MVTYRQWSLFHNLSKDHRVFKLNTLLNYHKDKRDLPLQNKYIQKRESLWNAWLPQSPTHLK